VPVAVPAEHADHREPDQPGPDPGSGASRCRCGAARAAQAISNSTRRRSSRAAYMTSAPQCDQIAMRIQRARLASRCGVRGDRSRWARLAHRCRTP
jgi:hypothetical protein